VTSDRLPRPRTRRYTYGVQAARNRHVKAKAKAVRRDRAPERIDGELGRRIETSVYVGHATTYVAVNLLLVVIWVLAGGGYFWPAWPLVCWGIALGVHSWVTWGRPGRAGTS